MDLESYYTDTRRREVGLRVMAYHDGYEIWSYLINQFENPYGVAGLMGNLFAESGLYSYRVQGDMDYEHGYPESIDYTADVNEGTISEYTFVHDGRGYGLAQWTYETRKQELYDRTIGLGLGYGIEDLALQLEFLVYEIVRDYPHVSDVLLHATSVREASDVVLHEYENPEEQGEDVEIERANYGIDIFNTYSGLPPLPPIPPSPHPTRRGKVPLYMYTLKRYRIKKGNI